MENFKEYKKRFIELNRKEELRLIYKELLMMGSSEFSESHRVKVTHQSLSVSILFIFDLVKNNYNQIYVYDSESKLFVELDKFLHSLLSDMSMKLDIFNMSNLRNLHKDIYITLTAQSRLNHIRKAKFAPKEIVLTSDNKAVNFITKEIIPEQDALLMYDFTYRSNRRIVSLDTIEHEAKAKYVINSSILHKIYKDWSNDNTETLNLYRQIAFASITGNNREKFFIILGGGGNGKSSFIEIIKSCVGSEFVVEANLHQFGDPNALNVINESTRLISGDDAAKSHKISGVAVANLKSIIGGNTLSLSRKYLDNIKVSTSAVMIQASNHIPSFFENDEAMASRLIAINWGAQSFRGKEASIIVDNVETKFNLKKMIQEDELFLDIFFSDIFYNTENFITFNIPEHVKATTADVLEDSDTIMQFVKDVRSSLNKMGPVPSKLLFEYFRSTWCPANSPSSAIMKFNTFGKEIKRVCNLLNIEIISQQLRYHEKFNPHITAIRYVLKIDNTELSKDKQSAIVFGRAATDEELMSFKDSIDILDNLDDEQYQLITLLCHSLKDTDAMSRFGYLM